MTGIKTQPNQQVPATLDRAFDLRRSAGKRKTVVVQEDGWQNELSLRREGHRRGGNNILGSRSLNRSTKTLNAATGSERVDNRTAVGAVGGAREHQRIGIVDQFIQPRTAQDRVVKECHPFAGRAVGCEQV